MKEEERQQGLYPVTALRGRTRGDVLRGRDAMDESAMLDRLEWWWGTAPAARHGVLWETKAKRSEGRSPQV